MTATTKTSVCFAANLPMWRRSNVVSAVKAVATISRAVVAASHGKGRTPTSEVDQ